MDSDQKQVILEDLEEKKQKKKLEKRYFLGV
jgi:hypothetical protein